MLLIFPLTALSYYVDSSSLLKIPLFFYASLYLSLSIGSASVYTINVYIRLEKLIEVLRTEVKVKKNFVQTKAHEASTENKIKTMARIYCDMVDSCDTANICFGFQMSLSFGLIFFYTLFTTFTAYTDFLNMKTLTPATFTSVVFCLYYNILVATVVNTCTEIGEKVALCLLKMFKIMFSFAKGQKSGTNFERTFETNKKSVAYSNDSYVQLANSKAFTKNHLRAVRL